MIFILSFLCFPCSVYRCGKGAGSVMMRQRQEPQKGLLWLSFGLLLKQIESQRWSLIVCDSPALGKRAGGLGPAIKIHWKKNCNPTSFLKFLSTQKQPSREAGTNPTLHKKKELYWWPYTWLDIVFGTPLNILWFWEQKESYHSFIVTYDEKQLGFKKASKNLF